MRREHLAIGRRQQSYLIAETASGSGRQQPLRNLLLLHAFPLNAGMWLPQMEMALPGWRLIAPDYSGFGESPLFGSSEARQISDLAGDTIDLLDRLEIGSAVVAGCSMGGYVALELVNNAAAYASGLVLIDTRAGADTEEGKAGRLKMLETIAAGGSRAVADDMTPKLLGATTRRDRPDLVEHVHAMISSADSEAIKMAVLAMMDRKDLTSSLSSVHVPTLIVAGAEDALIPLPAMQQMHGAIKGATFESIPGAGHLPNLEQPSAFNAALSSFLRRF